MDLRIPLEQHEPPPHLDLKVRSVRAWLDRLPLARSLDVGAELLDRLQLLNRSKVAAGDRQGLMEAFHPVVDTLLDEYEATIASAPTPMAATVVESLRLHRALAAELSIGYRILITEASGKMFAFGMRRQLPEFIRLALTASARVLRASWLGYHAEPEHAWLDLHRLFAVASRTGSAEASTGGAPSPRETYLDCLLVSLADPYRLSPAEHRRLPDVLKRHRDAAKLLAEYPDAMTPSHFFVAPERDARPMPLGVADQRTSVVNIVDATTLVARLNAHHRAVLNGEVPSSMTPYEVEAQASLLEYLITAWGGHEGRLEARESDGSSAITHVGVDEIATALGPHPVPASPDWEIANRSLGGLQLRHRGSRTPRRLAVGEAVSVHSVDGTFTPVGIVRWMRRSREGIWSCGVQILGPSATAASLLSTTPTGEPTQAPGLLLERDSLLAPPTLLALRGTHAEAREFAICQRDTTLRVRAGPLLEQNRLIEVFETDES